MLFWSERSATTHMEHRYIHRQKHILEERRAERNKSMEKGKKRSGKEGHQKMSYLH